MKKNNTVYIAASGDLRESANVACWPAQAAMERELFRAIRELGFAPVRAHPFHRGRRHGFISSQEEGLRIFSQLDGETPIIVAEAVWQYSHHVLGGLITHRGPILTVANWSGQWPGLVGVLNLNGSLKKAGVRYSTLWGEDFAGPFFRQGLATWLQAGILRHPARHARAFRAAQAPAKAVRVAQAIATDLRTRKSIMGVFDEGCMGMYNAIIPDELLFPCGVYKERLSQSALYYATTQVDHAEAEAVYAWLTARGMRFHLGDDPAQDLTRDQVITQCKMYVAACRLCDEFGCETVGIQYQQGLKDLLPASDLVEGILNNADRPPVRNAQGRVIRPGRPIVHFNEVDECAGLDGLLTNRVHTALGQPVETTLHDIRWGDWDRSGTSPDYVWVFLISGAAPPAHHVGGYRGTDSLRQPAMYFRLGGGTVRGVARPGELVWSRIFMAQGRLWMDIGRGQALALPEEETQRRWAATTVQWPIMHAVTYGVSRDEMMGRHAANHIQVAYAHSTREADLVLQTKARLAAELGITVTICGTRAGGKAWPTG